ncbi:Hypothetical predicted protein [Mytilus galloprovincialis]|uniref:Uncharacterized protein n=1 Tax=Mytilus galloprovincialis TaxID=29158 RepID=A0A8B6BSI7_MYTGA|nr:Hypothetical predicted protein [Mytilus galloprovincialis]
MENMEHLTRYLLLVIGVCHCTEGFGVFRNGTAVAVVNSNQIDQTSGMCASRSHPGYLYTHNDHGDGSHIYVLDSKTGHRISTITTIEEPIMQTGRTLHVDLVPEEKIVSILTKSIIGNIYMVVKSMFTCCLDNVVITCKHIADWCGLSFQINSGETLILPSNQCEREADMESEQQWTVTQKQFINDYRIYYQKMGLLVNEIDSNGPTGKMPKLPKKPKQRLSDVYGKVNKEKMTPLELHKYLTDNIADVNRTISRETFTDAYLLFGNESETNIVEKLKRDTKSKTAGCSNTFNSY